MEFQCVEQTIVVPHDAETFAERFIMMGCSESLREIIGHGCADIDVSVGALEHSDTPLVIGRIFEIGDIVAREFAQGEKSLMTHHHSLTETLEGEFLGGFQMPVADLDSVGPDYIGLAIQFHDRLYDQ